MMQTSDWHRPVGKYTSDKKINMNDSKKIQTSNTQSTTYRRSLKGRFNTKSNLKKKIASKLMGGD